MKKKKIILAVIILLVISIVGGTIAYFTDTDNATNTFTIGNVDITLTEPNWLTTDEDNNGIPDASQDLMPGQTIAKDPTINNVSTTNPAYVFAKVEVPCTTAVSPATPAELFSYTLNTGWTELTTAAVACTSGGTATHVYYFGSGSTLTSVAAGASTAAVFNNVTLLNTLTGTEGLTGNKNIVVTGYGIQTQGLANTTPTDVWANFS